MGPAYPIRRRRQIEAGQAGQVMERAIEACFVERIATMLRRGLFPIAFLAIALQVLLPVAMIQRASAALDPLSHATLCLTSPADATAPDGGAPSGHTGACPLCPTAITQVVVLPVGAPVIFKPIPRVVARYADPALSPAPRAPPAAWPDSRAPPTIS